MGSTRTSSKVINGGSSTVLSSLSSKALKDSVFSDEILSYHDSLFQQTKLSGEPGEESLAPIMTSCLFVDHQNSRAAPVGIQFGLLAKLTRAIENPIGLFPDDHRIFYNISPPSSTFICGSQGSGKSHTLSCLLENCLIPSRASRLPKPLTGLVFHYDTFISDTLGSPCEAAFLSSHPDVEVRVLCSPTNLHTMRGTYSRFKIDISPLQIDQKNLNTKRMLDLMAVGQGEGPMQLYMHTVKRILREMRIAQQQAGTGFDYQQFKKLILSSNLTPAQLEPLSQRLEMLESFMPQSQARQTGKKKGTSFQGTDWKPKARRLTVVDLSCPCISPETACSLFNICLGIFLEQDSEVGRVVALDEAHKYMNNSIEARGFTDTLLSAVRLQRHLGVRMIISTQEPTVSPSLLNLCSITIVHRFTSPEWLRILHKHLAGAGENLFNKEARSPTSTDDLETMSMFNQIVALEVGEALLFAPGAVIGTRLTEDNRVAFQRLRNGILQVKIRSRLTTDGGRSVLSM